MVSLSVMVHSSAESDRPPLRGGYRKMKVSMKVGSLLAAALLGGCAAAFVGGCCSEPVYDWDSDLQHRLSNDFCQTREEVKEYVARFIPDVTDEQIDAWTASGKLENMQIDGTTMYFESAGRNLFRIDPQAHAIWNACKASRNHPAAPGSHSATSAMQIVASGIEGSQPATTSTPANHPAAPGNQAAAPGNQAAASAAPGNHSATSAMQNVASGTEGSQPASSNLLAALPLRELPDYSGWQNANIVSVIRAGRDGEAFPEPKTFRVKYTVTVNADAVPAGETVRCWLPFPRTDLPRQTGVKLLSTSEPQYTAAAEGSRHSTIYMEKAAVQGQPTVFEEEFEFTSAGEYHDLRSYAAPQYDRTSAVWKEYTAEQPPHIVFTDRMRALSDSLTAGLCDPVSKAKAIFIWINDNFPWASAREYSTIPCIPEYVLGCGHGDCGQVTLLMMTLCRIAGIPAHFQSGFVIRGEEAGLHDWSELWFDGLGWVPVDMSRGLWEDAVRTIPFTCDPAVTVVPDNYRPDHRFASADDADLNDRYLWFHFGAIDSYRLVVNSDFGCALSPEKTFPRSETVDFQRGEVEWKGGNLYFDQWHRETTVIQ